MSNNSSRRDDQMVERALSAPHAALVKINRLLDLLFELVTSSLLVVIVGINAAEILYRLLLGGSFTWVFEINQLLANWLYFLGICLVYYRGQDITVEFLFDKLSRPVQRVALILIHMLVVGTLAIVAWYCVPLIELQSRSSTMGLGIPNHWFSLPLLIGSLAMILFVIADVADAWRELKAARSARI
jgi:TRAP-type C4-dicarboxylate transport system permease small subunit